MINLDFHFRTLVLLFIARNVISYNQEPITLAPAITITFLMPCGSWPVFMTTHLPSSVSRMSFIITVPPVRLRSILEINKEEKRFSNYCLRIEHICTSNRNGLIREVGLYVAAKQLCD